MKAKHKEVGNMYRLTETNVYNCEQIEQTLQVLTENSIEELEEIGSGELYTRTTPEQHTIHVLVYEDTIIVSLSKDDEYIVFEYNVRVNQKEQTKYIPQRKYHGLEWNNVQIGFGEENTEYDSIYYSNTYKSRTKHRLLIESERFCDELLTHVLTV